MMFSEFWPLCEQLSTLFMSFHARVEPRKCMCVIMCTHAKHVRIGLRYRVFPLHVHVSTVSA